MEFSLAPGVDYARVGDQPIFLDRAKDRYFGLKPNAVEGFLALAAGRSDVPESIVDALLRRGVIIRDTSGRGLEPFSWTPVCSSLIEASRKSVPSSRTGIAVALAMIRARRSLRTLSVAENLQRLTRRKAALPSASPGLIEAASAEFLAWRRYIPMRPVCLLDSVGLLEFLASRRCVADLVMAVGVKPFDAHCWVQTGDRALNETMLRVAGLKPILVI